MVSALVFPIVDCEISVPEEVSEVSARVFVEIGVVLSGDRVLYPAVEAVEIDILVVVGAFEVVVSEVVVSKTVVAEVVDVTSVGFSEKEGLEEVESVVRGVLKVMADVVSVVSMIEVEEGSNPDSVVSLVADVDEELSSVVVSLVNPVVANSVDVVSVEIDEVT